MEYLVKQQINFKFTYVLMRLTTFHQFSVFGVKFVTESTRKFFNFESGRRDVVLLLIHFMDENAYLYMRVVSKRHYIFLSVNFLSSGKFSQVTSRQKFITSLVPGTEESASNFFFNTKFVLKSRRSIYMLLGIFIIFL